MFWFSSPAVHRERRLGLVGRAAAKFVAVAILMSAAGPEGSVNAAQLALDTFTNYTAAPTSLNGQAGEPVPLGFTGSWTTPSSTTVVGGVLTTGASDVGRSYRPFGTSVTTATGTLSISFDAVVPATFSGIELAPQANDDSNSIRIATNGGDIVLQGKSNSDQNYVLHTIDGLSHTYTIELDPATKSGQVRYDSASWVSFAFTNVSGFALNYLSVADFSGSSMTLANFQISDASASSVPEIDPAGLGSVLALLGGVLGLVERRRLKVAC
jgi:hypothetical protein